MIEARMEYVHYTSLPRSPAIKFMLSFMFFLNKCIINQVHKTQMVNPGCFDTSAYTCMYIWFNIDQSFCKFWGGKKR